MGEAVPLDLTKLTLSPGLPGAQGADYPASAAEAAHTWAVAMGAYAATVAPVLALPVLPAQQALEGALLGAFTGPPEGVATAMEAAFTTFAAALVPLMLPTGYAAIPPPGAVGFAAAFAQLPRPQTREAGALRVAQRIDVWMRTGTATLVAPPYTPTLWL